MTIPDNNPDRQSGTSGQTRTEDSLNHIKEDVNEAIGNAREQADAHFGQYRDTAADQIDALARGAKSAMSELEANDTLGLSHYLADMADCMTGLAGKLRNKSAEELLHDGSRLARENPGLFLAGSVVVGFGLSRFLKAGTSPVAEDVDDPAAGHSNPPSGGFAGQRPFAQTPDPIGPGAGTGTGTGTSPGAGTGTGTLSGTSTGTHTGTSTGSGLATGITPSAPGAQDHPGDTATGSLPGSVNNPGAANPRGDL